MDNNELNVGDDPDAEGAHQGPMSTQILQTLKGLREQMDANHHANMKEFVNLNERMDVFQRALLDAGLQIPYISPRTNDGQASGLGNTRQQADHETTIPHSDP